VKKGVVIPAVLGEAIINSAGACLFVTGKQTRERFIEIVSGYLSADCGREQPTNP